MKIKLEDREKDFIRELRTHDIYQTTIIVWMIRYGVERVHRAFTDVRRLQKRENIGRCMNGLLRLENTDVNAQYEDSIPAESVTGIREKESLTLEAKELAAKSFAEIKKMLPGRLA